jgi:hypothetical protein
MRYDGVSLAETQNRLKLEFEILDRVSHSKSGEGFCKIILS